MQTTLRHNSFIGKTSLHKAQFCLHTTPRLSKVRGFSSTPSVNMVSVAGQVEIAASPEKVREVFLDFARYPDWAHTHIKAISVASRQEEGKLQAGDRLNVSLSGMNFSAVVNSNTAEEFSWTGSLPLGLFSGKHTFRFVSSEVTPGHTTFRDGEVFSGILTKVFGFMSSSKDGQMSKNFDAFDQELKNRVESLHGKE